MSVVGAGGKPRTRDDFLSNPPKTWEVRVSKAKDKGDLEGVWSAYQARRAADNAGKREKKNKEGAGDDSHVIDGELTDRALLERDSMIGVETFYTHFLPWVKSVKDRLGRDATDVGRDEPEYLPQYLLRMFLNARTTREYFAVYREWRRIKSNEAAKYQEALRNVLDDVAVYDDENWMLVHKNPMGTADDLVEWARSNSPRTVKQALDFMRSERFGGTEEDEAVLLIVFQGTLKNAGVKEYGFSDMRVLTDPDQDYVTLPLDYSYARPERTPSPTALNNGARASGLARRDRRGE